jgi:hypothetical protein
LLIKFDDGFKATGKCAFFQLEKGFNDCECTGIYDEGYDVGQVNVILIFSVSIVVVSIGSVVIFTVASTIATILSGSDPEKINGATKSTGIAKVIKTKKKIVI